jgi:hypothetical protein
MLQVTGFRPNIENIVFLTCIDENYKQVSPPERTEKRLSDRVVKIYFTVKIICSEINVEVAQCCLDEGRRVP